MHTTSIEKTRKIPTYNKNLKITQERHTAQGTKLKCNLIVTIYKQIHSLGKFAHTVDLKWLLDIDDCGRTPSSTSVRKLCESSACKQDITTFMKPKTAYLTSNNRLINVKSNYQTTIWIMS